jgi:two-component system cell cycle sensor histidine kinase/response regulator CckA
LDEPRFLLEQLSDVDDPRALLEGLFFHAPVAFQIYRADGHCLLVNPAFLAMYESAPPPEYNLFQDDILEKQGFLDLVRRAFQGETIVLPPSWYDPRELRQLEVTEGKRVAIQPTLFPLFDRERHVRHVAICVKDVTPELELRASEARYRAQFDAAPEAILTLDVDRGCFIEVNANAERLFGLPRHEILKRHPADLSPPQQPDGRDSTEVTRAHIERVMRGERLAFEWTHRNAAGDDIPCEIRLVRLPSDTHNLCRGSVVDISERKRAEAEQARLEEALRKTEEQLRQSQKMEAIGRLAGGIAHDFNNLLSVILGYSNILLADLKPVDPIRADLEAIRRSGQQAADLTRQLLAFSRRQVLSPRVVDLNDIVRDTDKMLRRLLGEDIELVVRVTREAATVKVDPGQLDQVIMNLAINARDAMPEGGKLTIETQNVVLDEAYARQHLGLPAGEYVRLAVSDTGLGMTPETQARIFEPFFTTKDQGKGTGLGLSTVFGIIQQSGGNIWVYSEPNAGTVFKIFLPAADAADLTPSQTAAPSTLDGTETILLVEDQEEVRQVAQEILRRFGYHVLTARNAGEALLFCERHPHQIHLLLTDVVMPQMNGPELAARLMPMRPDMKVLFMSGYTEDAIIHHGVLDSGFAYLQKPLVPESLGRRVREVLDGPARVAPPT